jgi:hypothetical protein
VHGITLRRFTILAFVLALVPLTLASCGGQPNIPLAETCHEQIMLSLAPGVGRTDRVMDGIEDDANVRLEYLRSAGPTLFVYKLSTRGRDPGCLSALSRLRQDSRVRFAESDRHRAVHGLAR